MAGMEIDSPPQRVVSLSPRDRIVQRLAMHGIPEAYLHQFQLGLVALVRDKKFRINDIVSCILPTDLDVSDAQLLSDTEIVGVSGNFRIKALFDESIWWLQWLMFAGDPQESLSSLLQVTAGQRAVCGAVWGQNDLAYRCRTCEHDPTCAICVSCFQNGNHKDHDYNIMYTGGGCCDCGDETAWRKEGFCSKHKGIEEISPLPQKLANSIGPVLDSLLSGWKDRVMAVQHGQGRLADPDETCRKAADGLSASVIQMLLDFCDCSESLLGFLCRRMSACSGLLDILLKAERLLDKEVVKKLHELLLKLLGDPVFKYDFAKIFIRYYPINMKAMISESSDSVLQKYPMLSTFSVQIFTVPTLTVRLVTEVDLLSVLLGCLKDLFLSFVDVDGHIQVRKWENMSETTIRLIEDVRYVMSHQEVQAHIAHERPEISRAWIFLLKLVQGMDAQIRITGIISEEENENLFIPFFLGHYLGNVNALLIGALSVERYGGLGKMHGADNTDGQRHAKVGRVLQESSASQTCTLEALQHKETHDGESCSSLSSSVVWLISECLKAIECWLRTKIELLNHSFYDIASSSGSNVLAQRKKLYRGHKGTNTLRVNRTSVTRMDMDVEVSVSDDSNERFIGAATTSGVERDASVQNNSLQSTLENNGTCLEHCALDDSLMEVESSVELAVGSIFSLSYFPNINYDVSSQEISFHIHLHRLLSLLLRKALKVCFALGQSGKTDYTTSSGVSFKHEEYFRKLLAGVHPYGFSAFIMEHPLQLRVCCAQVRAGMWRKSGDTAILCSEWYRSIRWFEQGLESDLFLLQCCAALAPPDQFVQRVLERFDLSNYLSLNLADYNEFEAVLVLEMLTLIIHIVKERRFCGLSVEENLYRELVYRLSIGDATHSQVVNSLPRDLSRSDKLQNVLDVLAVYCNPSGMKQGKYSLRKAYWKDLDLYHPRWSSKDLQVAEERYFRFCKVSALNAQLPRWTPVIEPLTPISRIATSNIVLQIVRAVLFYAFFSKTSSISRAPDAVLITALHLISLALDICDAHQLLHIDDPLPILIYACEECNVGSTNAAVFWKNQSLLSLLVSLMRKFKEENDMHVETRQCNVYSLIEVLLKRFSKLSPNCMVELQRLAPDVVFDSQVNRSDQNLASTSDVDDRKAKARQRQAAILEKMRAEQSKFVASLSYNSIEQETYKQKEPFPDDVKEEAIRILMFIVEFFTIDVQSFDSPSGP
ncbi:hypothetical protein HPP92_012233 [Vanilla planifolia]|uniref:E3 ubiquitin-protein ligase n=1 Tax=Vanilla planifolia TaxID=51239 RepID=A0A835V1S7_VANPL|nr:hypothetical protein HPP92_012233 [Vanilla planifolia]